MQTPQIISEGCNIFFAGGALGADSLSWSYLLRSLQSLGYLFFEGNVTKCEFELDG